MISSVPTEARRRSFQHNPYNAKLLDISNDNLNYNSNMSRAAFDFFTASTSSFTEEETNNNYNYNNIITTPQEKTVEILTEFEGGISEVGTDEASRTVSALTSYNNPNNNNNNYNISMNHYSLAMPSSTFSNVLINSNSSNINIITNNNNTNNNNINNSIIRYASVNFRFGSAWFIAPFRTAIGEMVVVEYPHNNSLHLGLVSCITTRMPPTFVSLLLQQEQEEKEKETQEKETQALLFNKEKQELIGDQQELLLVSHNNNNPNSNNNNTNNNNNIIINNNNNTNNSNKEESSLLSQSSLLLLLLRQCPRLLRHARDFDRQTKLELRAHDLRSLRSARALALEVQAPVTFIDAEWLLDLTAVTFLVQVWGGLAAVDALAETLAVREGAEVVFTYPSTSL